VFIIHGTKKFLERVQGPSSDADQPTTALGNWYATVVFWKPQAALFVNQRTLMPVIIALAPARTVTERFLIQATIVFDALGLPRSFIDAEIAEMGSYRLAKTESRSGLGSMNEFAYLGKVFGGSKGRLGRFDHPVFELAPNSCRHR
jgi:hypothetical protein